MPIIKLKSVVEALDAVPEAYRERYTERDGKFHLDEIEIDDKQEVHTALEKEREERRKAKEQLEKFNGLDPDKAREALKKEQAAEEAKLKEKGKYEELLAKQAAQAAKDIAAREAKITEQTAQLRKFKLDDVVRSAALRSGVLADDIEDVMVITSSRFDLDADGAVVMKDNSGLTADKFFETVFKEQKPKFYAPSGAGGSGAPPTGGQPPVKVSGSVSISDQDALNSNIDKIASGEVVVK